MDTGFNHKTEIERLIAIFGEEEPEDWDKGDAPPTPQQLARIKLILVGEPAVPALIAALNSENVDIRLWAGRVLSDLADQRAVAPFLAWLGDKNENGWQRWAIASALANIGDKRVVAPLLKILKSEREPKALAGVAIALGSPKASQAVEPLIEVLSENTDSLVRRYCVTH